MSDDRRGPSDWRTALALAWGLGCGLLYARMVIIAKLPTVAAWFR